MSSLSEELRLRGSMYLYFPEDGASVTVVVVSQGNVLHITLSFFQVRPHVLEEPWLEPPPYLINL